MMSEEERVVWWVRKVVLVHHTPISSARSVAPPHSRSGGLKVRGASRAKKYHAEGQTVGMGHPVTPRYRYARSDKTPRAGTSVRDNPEDTKKLMCHR